MSEARTNIYSDNWTTANAFVLPPSPLREAILQCTTTAGKRKR